MFGVFAFALSTSAHVDSDIDHTSIPSHLLLNEKTVHYTGNIYVPIYYQHKGQNNETS